MSHCVQLTVLMFLFRSFFLERFFPSLAQWHSFWPRDSSLSQGLWLSALDPALTDKSTHLALYQLSVLKESVFHFRNISEESVTSVYRFNQRFTVQILEKAEKTSYSLFWTYSFLPDYFTVCLVQWILRASLGGACIIFSLRCKLT